MTLCAHIEWHLARAGASNGVGAWCPACASWVTKLLGLHTGWALPKTHPKLDGVDRDALPRVHPISVACDICEQTTQTPELHHWCPQALYRDTPPPNGGPLAWLCPSCHATWHAIVTPGLTSSNALVLVRAIYRRMKARPGAWAAFVRTVIDADAKVRRVPLPPQRDPAA